MASLFTRSIATKLCKLVVNVPKPKTVICNQLTKSFSHTVSPVTVNALNLQNRATHVTFGKNCCCQKSSLHTEADTSFTEYLKEQLKNNKKERLPSVDGWKVETDDALITLRKSVNGEQITVTMNINEAGTEDIYAEHDEVSYPQSQLDDLPPFIVEIKKQTGRTLRLQCEAFGQEVDAEGQNQNPEEVTGDNFAITEATMHFGEFQENNTIFLREHLDEEMYENLMNLLDGRGLDNEFVEKLVDLSETYGSGKYVDFLGDLAKFVEEK